MKRDLLLLFFVGVSFCLCAQSDSSAQKFHVKKPGAKSTSTVRYFALVVNGHYYNKDDTIGKEELKAITKSAVKEIVDTTSRHPYKIINYTAFISAPHLKSVLREFGELSGGTPKATFDDVINIASSGDTYWLDGLHYSINGPLLPKQFTLTVK